MVGKKGYKNSEIQNEANAKSFNEDEENSEFILDLDELHMNVTPPSELNDNCSPKTEDKRKKVRHHRHILNFAVDTQFANNKCHQCRRKNLKYGLFKCSRKECSILYCAICIKKYSQQYNICFYCQQVCKCKVCRTKFENQLSNDDFSEEGNYNSFDEKNMVKIDDFLIIEKKDSEFDINENYSNINENNLKSINKLENIKNKFNKKKSIDNLNSLANFEYIKKNNPKGKLKNLKSNKLKKCKAQNLENLKLVDKVTEKVNNDLSGKFEIPLNCNFIAINKSDDTENFNKNQSIGQKFIEKLPQNDKLYTLNNKNKIKKNETLDLSTIHLFSTVNSKIYNNIIKQEKIKKGKIENLTQKESKDVKNQGNNLSSNTNDLIKHIEIHNNSNTKSKKTLYKHCLYCKNEKMNVATILRFKSSEDFILYSKDFYEKMSDEEKRIYKDSKSIFENFINNYYKKCSQVNNFTFKSIKYICMSCFKENLKEENGFINILNTLQYGLIPEESKNLISKNNADLNKITNKLKQNENINLESQLSLHIFSKDKCELLGQKKKNNSKISKNNSEEKVQKCTSNTMNFSFLSNNLKTNSDIEIINNLLSFKKLKTSNINENNNYYSAANNNNNINNFKIQNLNTKTQISNNSPNFNNHLLPSISSNLINQNSHLQLNHNSNQEYNSLNNTINSSNLNNHNFSNKTNILNNYNILTAENKNLNAHNQHNISNNKNHLNNSTSRIIFSSSNQQNLGNSTSNKNLDYNIIQHAEKSYESKSDTILNSKLDDIYNSINQDIDEIYKSTKDTLGDIKEDVDLNNISMIFETNEGELKNKQNFKNSLDSLDKHFYLINQYSFNQKLMLSHIIQNIEYHFGRIPNFLELIKDQKYNVDNVILKMKNSYEIKNHQNSFQINNLINNINSQFNNLDKINNESLTFTDNITNIIENIKAKSNQVLEELDNNNKIKSNSLIDLSNKNRISYPNINYNLNNNYENSNWISNQNYQTINNFHSNNNTSNIFQNIQQPMSNSNQNLIGGFGSNDLFFNPINNINAQTLNQNIDDNAKNNCSINNAKLEGNNYQILNSEGTQNNLYIQNNKVLVNYGYDFCNVFNPTDWRNPLFYNNNPVIHNHLSKIIDDEIFMHKNATNSNKFFNNQMNDISNNYKNSNQQISSNILNIGSFPNQFSLQKNVNPTTNIANCQIRQNHILDEIVPQNYSNQTNKFNPESQINLYPELSSITMLPTGPGSLNIDFTPNYVPLSNIQKSQISGIKSSVNPIMGANLPLNNFHSLNSTTSLNNPLIQQQHQSLKLLNVNNQLFPTQLGNHQYFNSLTQTQNIDFLNNYPNGINIQSNNGENAKPQINIIGGMSVNQK